uniref:uncharacterized protein LOC122591943 n=1 Tax=Erigeron canadensis TaxID=72917 RepID=UPI001CB9C88D|nr:uncharacterized protein LOC122591943 [Erigeron canadensis]
MQGFDRWDWSSSPGSNEEIEEHEELKRLLEGVRFRDSIDKWQWMGGSSKEFSVKEAKRFLSKDKDYSGRFVFAWSKWIPKKCNLFMWRAVMDRIPTLKALQRRNCTFGSMECSMCNEGDETTDHILCGCTVSNKIWQKISSWCKVRQLIIFSVKDLIKIHLHLGLGKKESRVFKCIVSVACWCIWKARNETIFEKRKLSAVV